MLSLHGRVISIKSVPSVSAQGAIFRATELAASMGNSSSAYIVRNAEIPKGHAAYLFPEPQAELAKTLSDDQLGILLPPELSYISDGDIVRVEPDGRKARVLYRRNSPSNHFLVTERCDNYCLMCSQPPRDVDDGWVIEEILECLPLISQETKELGFTGGEPTLLGQRFLDVLAACKMILPQTGIHVLSNGRRFSDVKFTRDWAKLEHPDLMVGIPVYSDVSTIHDYVVQADGAYDQTIRGILNLKELEQRVEIRVVLHKQTFSRLPQLAEFLARNLLFVDHVALMGLEIMGFTRANLESLWIDPTEYQKELYEAVQLLDSAGMRVSIYNLPLCLLDRRLWSWAVQSISDWKNEYLPECEECSVKNKCAGFFFSAKYKSSNKIRAIQDEMPFK